jgi:hypothetical protein
MITLEWGLSKVVGKIESHSAPRTRRKDLANEKLEKDFRNLGDFGSLGCRSPTIGEAC